SRARHPTLSPALPAPRSSDLAAPRPAGVPPFPTRPSSALTPAGAPERRRALAANKDTSAGLAAGGTIDGRRYPVGGAPHNAIHRSEEHTSELQSRENLVCRLRLEEHKSEPRPRYRRTAERG